MKRLFTLTCLLAGIAILLSAQEIQPRAFPYANLPVGQYQMNDPAAKQLNYVNTVCDTLLYNGQAILLDKSPLLQLSEVKELVQQYRRPCPTIAFTTASAAIPPNGKSETRTSIGSGRRRSATTTGC